MDLSWDSDAEPEQTPTEPDFGKKDAKIHEISGEKMDCQLKKDDVLQDIKNSQGKSGQISKDEAKVQDDAQEQKKISKPKQEFVEDKGNKEGQKIEKQRNTKENQNSKQKQSKGQLDSQKKQCDLNGFKKKNDGFNPDSVGYSATNQNGGFQRTLNSNQGGRGRGSTFQRDDKDFNSPIGGRGAGRGYDRNNNNNQETNRYGGRGGSFGGDRDFNQDRGGFGGRGGSFGGDRDFNQDRGGFGGRGFRGGFGGRDDYGGGRGSFRGREGRGGGRGFRNDRDEGSGFGRGRGGYRDFSDRNQGGGYSDRRDFGYSSKSPQSQASSKDAVNNNILQEISDLVPDKIDAAELSMLGTQTEPIPTKKTSQFRINTTMATAPLGQKCWPLVSIYVRRCKITVILSRIPDHICSVLYFPYSKFTMNYYPGNMINQCSFDYRKKLAEKDKPTGQSYLQKCVGIKNINAFAFARIDEENKEDSVQSSVKDMFNKCNQTNRGSSDKNPFKSIVIPYSTQLGNAKKFLQQTVRSLEESQGIKEVIVSTNKLNAFYAASEEFLKIINRLAENNEIVID